MSQTPPNPHDLALSRDGLTLSSRLVVALRGAILDGTLPPGRNLRERELCEMFGVSRGLVREAIQKLASEGLITIIAHKGPEVARLDRAAARHLYLVRGALEGLATEAFTRHADPATRARLRQIHADLCAIKPDAGGAALIRVKNDFYACVLEGAGNPVLQEMFTQLNNRITQLRLISMSQPGRLQRTQAEIGAILAAIDADDPAAARRLAEAHVASAAAATDACFHILETENPDKGH